MEEVNSDRSEGQRRPALREGDCANCGTPLRGPYCHQCGQRARDRIAPLGPVLKDLLSETFNFDTRVFRTLAPLLTQPGRLTKEYIAGRRAEYVPPLRLFVFSSFVLFLLLGIVGNWAINDSPSPRAAPLDTLSAPKGDTTRAVGVDLESGSALDMSPAAHDSLAKLADSLRQQGTLSAQFEYAMINGSLQAASNPERFIQSAVGRLSGLSFLMLPIFALILKLLYLRTGRFYVGHLIFGLHVHAFLFILLIVVTLLSLPDSTTLETTAGLLAGIGPPLYLLMALRRVYEQGWGLTLLKWAVLLVVYGTVLSTAFALYLVLTLMLL